MRVRRSMRRTILNGRQPMSFFSSITSVFHSTENTETPVSATFASRKDTVYAPISARQSSSAAHDAKSRKATSLPGFFS